MALHSVKTDTLFYIGEKSIIKIPFLMLVEIHFALEVARKGIFFFFL